jgi:hypothetical protein
MDRKEFVMKQIIINITVNEQGEPMTILNCTKADDSKIVKVIQSMVMTENDKLFIEEIKNKINDYYGN